MARGDLTEELYDIIVAKAGGKKLESQYGSNNGFDGVHLMEDGTVIIGELKQMKSGGFQLSRGNPNTLLPPQMTSDYLDYQIAELLSRGGDYAVTATLI